MKPKKKAEEPWLQWLREQMQAGSDLKQVHSMLRERGMSDEAIAHGLELVRPIDSALADGRLGTPPLIRRAPPNLRKVDVPQLDLFILDNFMSAKDCERLIALTSHHLIPSPLAHDPGDAHFRTSKTCALGTLRSPLAVDIDARISRTIGIRPAYGEGIQAQRYDVGEQFKPHCDYFDVGSEDFLRFAAVRGNRTWSFMVYLNEGMEGGATRFTEANHSITPKTGMAVLWDNLRVDGTPNPGTKHCGEPVTRGCKVIITKWFRVLGTGPVFYE